MSKKNPSALRRIEAHNRSPQPESLRVDNSHDRESSSRSHLVPTSSLLEMAATTRISY